MSGNGYPNSLESISLEALPSVRSLYLAGACQPSGRQNSNHQLPGSDRSVNIDATPPPLGVKLTGYKPLFMTTVFCFGTVKSILTYMGQSIAPTTLAWVSGTFLGVGLYWLGLYDERSSDKLQRFFQVDYALAICYFAKCAVGGLIWPLSICNNILPFVFLEFSLMSVVADAQICYFPDTPLIDIANTLGIVAVATLLCLGFRRFNLLPLPGLRGSKSAVDFVNIYGPGGPCVQRYGLLGAAGTIVGFLCGVVLFIFLPAVALPLLHYTLRLAALERT